MKHEVKSGQTDYSVLVFIPDPASTDGSGKTGLVAADLTVSGVRVETDNDVTVTDYTSSLSNLSALTDAHADWGVKEVSSTLAPGLYRLDIADAIFASGAWSAVVYVMITTSAAAPSPMEFVMVPESPITGVNAQQIGGTNQTGRDIGASVLLSSGTGTGQVKLASGYVAPNWGDVGNPTTVVGLSGTTVKTATDVETDTADIQSRLPAALVSGRMDSNMQAAANGVITAAVVADGAIDAATFAAGAITATVIADGAIDAATFAANAITASALATDAVNEIVDATWDELVADHAGVGSTGAALSAAGSAGDPWSTALPGAYGAGTAGKIVGDNINATISSRSTLDAAGIRTAVGLGSANLDTQLADIPTVAEFEARSLPSADYFVVGDYTVPPTANANADALLKRDMSAVTGEAARSPLNGFRFLVNGFNISGVTLNVVKEDGSTTAYSRTLATDAAADPVTGMS